MTDPELEPNSAASSEDAPHAVTLEDMLERLTNWTRTSVAALETAYDSYAIRAQIAVENSTLYDRLLALHTDLSAGLVAGKIAGVESWGSGATGLHTVVKSWPSLIDKLYRINYEENSQFSNPPLVFTIEEQAAGQDQRVHQRWITPDIAHEVVDDLVRTKFVVPFVDGVVDVSDRIVEALDDIGLRRFRRYHAKDTGYHARHYYALLEVPGDASTPATTVAFEIKVLTKLQDQLGELTHLLYERHRTGAIKLEKKRKVAWQFGTPDFLAAYLGHSAHFLESSMADLKSLILELESDG